MLYKVYLAILIHIAFVASNEECSLNVDLDKRCTDPHAECMLDTSLQQYTCQCSDGYTYNNGRCRTEGTPLPVPDYDSDWVLATKCNKPPYCDFRHGLSETPVIVDVQVDDNNVVFNALGFRPDEQIGGFNVPNFVMYIYDDQYINVSTTIPFGGKQYESLLPHYYIGYNTHSGIYYSWIRARAWKLSSLPDPDFQISEKTMKANSSKSEDSYYEVRHGLGEYPGLVVVRAKMALNDTSFYATGVGSALNVFYNDTSKTNAYLVYGFNDESFRVWVDSSTNGAIFDGRKYTRFDWMVSEATVQIFAWKLATLPPYLTTRISLDIDKVVQNVEFPIKFRISNSLTMAFAEINNDTAKNNGYRFPTSGYSADRFPLTGHVGADDCILGGARFSYLRIPSYFLILSDSSGMNKWWISIPEDRENIGLLCIPQSFGKGSNAERTNGGMLVVYNWNPDCGIPEGQHSTLDNSANGTEIGAYAQKTCDLGYSSRDSWARCTADLDWFDTSCYINDCGEYETPGNGTANGSNGTTYGSVVTFDCNKDYVLVGDKEITCLANRTWSGNTTHCVHHSVVLSNSTIVKPGYIIIYTLSLVMILSFA